MKYRRGAFCSFCKRWSWRKSVKPHNTIGRPSHIDCRTCRRMVLVTASEPLEPEEPACSQAS